MVSELTPAWGPDCEAGVCVDRDYPTSGEQTLCRKGQAGFPGEQNSRLVCRELADLRAGNGT